MQSNSNECAETLFYGEAVRARYMGTNFRPIRWPYKRGSTVHRETLNKRFCTLHSVLISSRDVLQK